MVDCPQGLYRHSNTSILMIDTHCPYCFEILYNAIILNQKMH